MAWAAQIMIFQTEKTKKVQVEKEPEA